MIKDTMCSLPHFPLSPNVAVIPLILLAGHLDCVVAAIKRNNGRPPGNDVLNSAVGGGHLPVVEYLVTHGLFHQPHFYDCRPCWGFKAGLRPDQLRCLQHLFDMGCRIHSGTLISAARSGDVDSVRFLHSRGLSFWVGAAVESATEIRCSETKFCAIRCLAKRILLIPEKPEDASRMWRAVRYGSLFGAPLTPVMQEVFKSKRRSTRATLLCFHVATRLSRGEGPPEQRVRESHQCRPHGPHVMQQLQSADPLETPGQTERGLHQCQPPRADAMQQLQSADPLETPEQREGGFHECQAPRVDAMQQLQSADPLETPEEREGGFHRCQEPRADAMQQV
jgi:hypothetical protein